MGLKLRNAACVIREGPRVQGRLKWVVPEIESLTSETVNALRRTKLSTRSIFNPNR